MRNSKQTASPSPVQAPAEEFRLEDIYGNHPDDKLTGGSQIFYWNELPQMAHVPSGRRYYDKNSVVYAAYRAAEAKNKENERLAQEQARSIYVKLAIFFLSGLITMLNCVENFFKDSKKAMLAVLSILLLTTVASAFVYDKIESQNTEIKERVQVLHLYEVKMREQATINDQSALVIKTSQQVIKEQHVVIADMTSAINEIKKLQAEQKQIVSELQSDYDQVARVNSQLRKQIKLLKMQESM